MYLGLRIKRLSIEHLHIPKWFSYRNHKVVHAKAMKRGCTQGPFPVWRPGLVRCTKPKCVCELAQTTCRGGVGKGRWQTTVYSKCWSQYSLCVPRYNAAPRINCLLVGTLRSNSSESRGTGGVERSHLHVHRVLPDISPGTGVPSPKGDGAAIGSSRPTPLQQSAHSQREQEWYQSCLQARDFRRLNGSKTVDNSHVSFPELSTKPEQRKEHPVDVTSTLLLILYDSLFAILSL